MPTKVIRVVNPAAVDVPEIRTLFEKAMKASLFRITNFDDVVAEVRAILADPNFGCFVAVEKGHYAGVLVVSLPRDKLIVVPQITIFYSEGPKAVKDALIRAGLDWGVSLGFTTFWAINVSGRSDATWARAFAKGGSSKRIGSVMEFTVGG